MKYSARTILESAIIDNQYYIKENDNSNIYDYFTLEIEMNFNYAYSFFTEDEITEIEKNENSKELIFNELFDLLKEYDFNIDEYIL